MKTLQSLLERLAGHPDQAVLIEFQKETVHEWTARELVDGIERLFLRLRQASVDPGDAVVLLAAPGPQWAEGLLFPSMPSTMMKR